VDDSYDPDQFSGVHLEYYYSQDVNFGRFFKHGRKTATPMEKAYLEARQNGNPAALIVSRPHDNYYIIFDSFELYDYHKPRCSPTIRWLLLDQREGEHRDMVMLNLKDWLAL
jgi:hypothetical protein